MDVSWELRVVPLPHHSQSCPKTVDPSQSTRVYDEMKSSVKLSVNTHIHQWSDSP